MSATTTHRTIDLRAAAEADTPCLCSHTGCGRRTSGGKPVCAEHLAALPNVQRIMAELSKRQVEETPAPPPRHGPKILSAGRRPHSRRTKRVA